MKDYQLMAYTWGKNAAHTKDPLDSSDHDGLI